MRIFHYANELVLPPVTPLSADAVARISKVLPRSLDEISTARLSAAIRFVVSTAGRPTLSEYHGILSEQIEVAKHLIALTGDKSAAGPLGAECGALRDAAAWFCERAEAHAEAAKTGMKRGRPKREDAIAQTEFLKTLIDIGEWAGLKPTGVPNAECADRDQFTPFFKFIKEAIKVAKDVINAMPITGERQRAAISYLQLTDRALGCAIDDCKKGRDATKQALAAAARARS